MAISGPEILSLDQR